MISARFLDHRVTIWGSQEFRGPTFGDVTRRWSQVPFMGSVPIGIQVRRENRNDTGPGERTVGEYFAYGSAALDVVEGDVIEVESGPEASPNPDEPVLLKVDLVKRPMGRHTELTLIDWQGALA